jgi:glutaredoxin 3
MNETIVYTTSFCPYCSRVKALLDARDIPYTEIDLERDPEGRAELQAITGMMTFPQVLIGGQPVGGFQETLRADRSGLLRELLQAAA